MWEERILNRNALIPVREIFDTKYINITKRSNFNSNNASEHSYIVFYIKKLLVCNCTVFGIYCAGSQDDRELTV